MANLILSSFGHVKNYENHLRCRAIWHCKQDRKYLVSLDRFIAWSPLVFRPGRARTRTLAHSQTGRGTGPWSGSTNQNWQGGRPAWDQDKSDSDPDSHSDVDPDSKDVCACAWTRLGWAELLWDAVAWGLNGSEFIKLRGDKRVATYTAEGFHAVR